MLNGLSPYSSMVSPDSETVPNSLVLVGHGIHGDIRRFEEMKISTCRMLLKASLLVFNYADCCNGQKYPIMF